MDNEKRTLNFLHSGDMGDLIAGLYAVRTICEQKGAKANLLLDTNGGKHEPLILRQSHGQGLKFNDASYEFLKPLLEAQSFVSGVAKWIPNNPIQIDYDLNQFRKIFFKRELLQATNQNLLYSHQLVFGLPMECKGPWLDPIEVAPKRDILLSRSTRYHSSDQMYLIQRDKPSMSFMGTDLEAKCFYDCTRMEVPRVAITNALDAAKEIAASELFLVNGTLFYWIALGIGHKNIWHELGEDIPTTYFKNGEQLHVRYCIGAHFVR